MTEQSFDIHAVLTGRKYPTGVVHVWFDEEPWYELAALEKRHADLGADDPELLEVESRIEDVKAKIGDLAYVVHIRGISPRAGEDIISSSLSTYPIKRDMYGREDEHEIFNRNRHMSAMSFAAHIVKIVNPDDAVAEFTDDNRLDMARAILGEAPRSAITAIDKAIAEVSREFADQQAKYTSPDFL